MSLSGAQISSITDALLAAYSRDELRRMVRDDMDEDFEFIVSAEKTYDAQLFDFVQWADRLGRVLELLEFAAAKRPRNTGLQVLWAEAQRWEAETQAAAQQLRDCSLPAWLLEILQEPLRSLGFHVEQDRVPDIYAVKRGSEFVFSSIRNDDGERILLYFPDWLLKQAPQAEVTTAIAYMGHAFSVRVSTLYVCSEDMNHLPAAYMQIIGKYWHERYGMTGEFVAWDSLMALKDSSLEEQQGELLKGELNLEELIADADGETTSLRTRLEKLSGDQQSALQETLLDAFGENDLRSMVQRTLNERLDEIAGGDNLTEIVFNLIDWAERNGKLNELIDGAFRANPGNPSLKKFVASLGG